MDAFFLIKKLNFLLQPWTWILGLIVAALLVRDQRKSRRILALTLAMAIFLSNNFIVDELLRAWEVPVHPTSEYRNKVQTAILLGGGLSYDKDVDRVNYGTNADRYIQVLEPLRNGLAKRVVVSGGAANLLEPWTFEAEMLRRFLINAGIDSSRILTERNSRTTHENAVYCKALLDSLEPGGSFLLVTSAVHMRRAMACFSAQGLNVRPYTVQKMVGHRRYGLSYLLVPSMAAIGRWEQLMHELFGYAYYFATGRV
jgi:uncharacterized SAM-binding protein YcdF (DUF218 family)